MTDLDGATTLPGEAAITANAGEFAALWNNAHPERREQIHQHLLRAGEEAHRCFIQDHTGRLRPLTAEDIETLAIELQMNALRTGRDEWEQHTTGAEQDVWRQLARTAAQLLGRHVEA